MTSLDKLAVDDARVKEILAEIKPLAAEYYRLTGKPLGVTGEIGEYVAAELLGLTLEPPRTKGYDAIRDTAKARERIQIKARAYNKGSKRGQRLGTIKLDAPCDVVVLVLLDNETLEAIEIWEAPFSKVRARLEEPGSKARNVRGALAISDFTQIGRCVWPPMSIEQPLVTSTA